MSKIDGLKKQEPLVIRKSKGGENTQQYENFLNKKPLTNQMVELALRDVLTSGLSPEILKEAQVTLFNDDTRVLQERLGRTFIKNKNLLKDFVLIEFPYYYLDGTIDFYRYKLVSPHINAEGQEIKYLHPIGQPALPYIPLQVWEIRNKPNKPIWITEGEKKALKLLQHGTYAIALSGVWNFKAGKNSRYDEDKDKDLWSELKEFEWQGRTVFIAFDSDLITNPRVRQALWEFAMNLYALDAIIKFPKWKPSEGKGIDDYLAKINHPEKALEALQEKALLLEKFASPEYEEAIVRALSKVNLSSLKFERLLESLAKRLGFGKKTLLKLVNQKRTKTSAKAPYTEEEKQMALALLQNPNLIEEFLKTLHTCYVDRDDELILLKLATVSRHFESGISVVITGTSSVGKSEMVKAILKTVAEKDKEDFTRITQNYLLYSDNPLDHKIVTIFEMKGTEDSAHILRTALTEGKLILGTVDKNITGELGARKIEKSSEGIVFISTLASGKLDWEFSTRILALELTHDETLARKVFNQKAKRVQTAHESSNIDEPAQIAPNKLSAGNGSLAQRNAAIPFRIWQVADQLLESNNVIIPFADVLAELFPTREERYMRDFDKVLTLIKSSALLFQYQNDRDEKGNIIASLEDYELVYSLRSLITQSVSPVPTHIIEFLKMAKDLSSNENEVTRADLQTELQKSTSTIKRYISFALHEDLIEVEGKGKKQKIKVIEIPKETSPLPEPEKIDNFMNQ